MSHSDKQTLCCASSTLTSKVSLFGALQPSTLARHKLVVPPGTSTPLRPRTDWKKHKPVSAQQRLLSGCPRAEERVDEPSTAAGSQRHICAAGTRILCLKCQTVHPACCRLPRRRKAQPLHASQLYFAVIFYTGTEQNFPLEPKNCFQKCGVLVNPNYRSSSLLSPLSFLCLNTLLTSTALAGKQQKFYFPVRGTNHVY